MMNLQELNASLLVDNEKLRSEVENLSMLQSLVKENLALRSKLDSLTINNTLMERSEINAGRKPTLQNRERFMNESSFRAGLRPPCHHMSSTLRDAASRSVRPDASSSFQPLEGMKSTLQHRDSFLDESSFKSGVMAPPHMSSTLRDTVTRSVHPETSSFTLSCPHLEDKRFLGEMAFQLERRIVSHVFYKQNRLYGFTVHNIQQKIVEVSTHPLTGEVDQAYRTELTMRYEDLMEKLAGLGYNRTLHPLFTEFIINTYGILKDRVDTHTARAWNTNDPDALQNALVQLAPSTLFKDLLILYSCLRFLMKMDGKAFILW